ncbi:MAG: substrate-binding domain-containing protein, partial [Betaproteobacteria bacterium]
QLGVADQVLPKSRLVGSGQRVGSVNARGELDFGIQQITELLPVEGIAHITPLPPELQKVSSFMAGIGANSPDKAIARKAIGFLASAEASPAITDSGLEPLA